MMIEIDRIAAERAMLLRYCTRYTGDPDVAEDLVQATLLAAWRQEEQLRDPQARAGWLLSIARNTCAMWGRQRRRERPSRAESGGTPRGNLEDELPDAFDLEVELERDELAELLDRALALLSPETREVLIRRYIEESSQAEIAEMLQLSEGAVEGRLHRGKLALRAVLVTELSEEALSYGLISSADIGWQTTRMWCPGCGESRLEGQIVREDGRLLLRCPRCVLPYDNYVNAYGYARPPLKTFRPSTMRVLDAIHDMFHVRATGGWTPCPGCGTSLPIERRVPYDISIECKRCHLTDHESWHSLTWSLPETRAFWREHPRMRFLPEREIELDGVPAILTGFENLAGTQRLEVVSLQETARVVHISGPSLHGASSPQR